MDSQNTDPGPGGFLSIFGDRAKAAAEHAETTPETAAPAEPTAAETAAPDVPDGELSADAVVAARLAASLADDGIEPPQEEPETAAEPDTAAHALLGEPEAALSLDALTPEQLRTLAEEAIQLRGQVSASTQQEAGRKVAAAEAAAVAGVQAEYERNVLAVSASHYDRIYAERMARIEEASERQDDPARYRLEQGAALRRQIQTAQQQWEDEQASAYEERARQAALAARLRAPEFRQYAAEHLVQQAGLPAAAVEEVLKTQDTRQFEARVQELVAIRDALLAERARNQTQRREDANRHLREVAPRTAVTGRPPGGKPPAYRGVAAEGAAIIRTARHLRRGA